MVWHCHVRTTSTLSKGTYLRCFPWHCCCTGARVDVFIVLVRYVKITSTQSSNLNKSRTGVVVLVHGIFVVISCVLQSYAIIPNVAQPGSARTSDAEVGLGRFG